MVYRGRSGAGPEKKGEDVFPCTSAVVCPSEITQAVPTYRLYLGTLLEAQRGAKAYSLLLLYEKGGKAFPHLYWCAYSNQDLWAQQYQMGRARAA